MTVPDRILIDKEEKGSVKEANPSRLSEQRRYFHATNKKEILPLIGIGLGVVGFYSYRAMKQMDQDWEDYEEALHEYNIEHGISNDMFDEGSDEKPATTRGSFSDGTIGIDLGTMNIRISHKPSSLGGKSNVIVNREGARATPNYIMFESDGTMMTGQMAASKLHERYGSDTPVLNPSSLLKGNSLEKSYAHLSIVEETISSCARNALESIIGGNHTKSQNLFSIDVNATGGFNVQPVFAYPPSQAVTGKGQDDTYLQLYQEKAQKLAAPSAIAKFVEEPVCAITAAQNLKVIPITGQGPVMVFDIGDKVTSISLVEEESKKVIYHTKLDGFGGETLVQAVVTYISKSFYGTGYEAVSDKIGVQRLFDAARSAVLEISSGGKTNHGRVQVNIPYLSVDEKMKPKHLSMGVSSKVFEAELTSMVVSRVSSEYSDQDVFSMTLEKPADLEGLFTSMIMRVLESSGINPFALGPILVIGGGARSPILQNAIQKAFSNLAGEQFTAEKLVIPKDELIEELVVLGASMMTE